MYGDGNGLWLKVTETGGSWVFRYAAIESNAEREERKASGKRQRAREMGLGPLDRVSLLEARKLAREKAQLRANGVDPLADLDARKDARRVERAATVAAKQAKANRPVAPIFDRAVDAYIAANASKWRSRKHEDEWRESLKRHVSPVFGGKPIDEIRIQDVLSALRPIWKTIPVTASRIRGRIERVLDRVYVHLYPDNIEAAQELVRRNPSRMNAHLRHLLGDNTHSKQKFAALSYKDIGKFMIELRTYSSIVSRALEFTILTASRASMTIGMVWGEVDLVGRIWTVPAERMKNEGNGDHITPLSDRAIEILEGMRAIRSGDRVFPISHLSMWALLQRMRSGVTVHGFRSCFRDWAGDCAELADELPELQLAHDVGDATRRAYRRSSAVEKRRTMMQAWADFCATEFVNNVVLLPSKVA